MLSERKRNFCQIAFSILFFLTRKTAYFLLGGEAKKEGSEEKEKKCILLPPEVPIGMCAVLRLVVSLNLFVLPVNKYLPGGLLSLFLSLARTHTHTRNIFL